MADLAQLEAALVKADAAGDSVAAKAFADEIRRQRGVKPAPAAEVPPEPSRSFGQNVGDFARAFGHNVMSIPHGGAQLVEQIAAGLAQRVAPESKVANAIAENAMRTDRAMAEREAAYQAKTPDSPGAITGAVAGSVAPFFAGGAIPRMLSTSGASMPAKIASGAGAGGVAGVMSPTTDPADLVETKATQAGGGALLGGVIPPVVGAAKAIGKGVYGAIEPALPSGPADILARFQQGNIGGAKQKIVDALEQAKTIVPGSRPTSGEAISEIPEATALAAHQRAVSKVPGASAEFMARGAEQQGARRAAIGTVAGTDDDLARAVSERAKNAKINYGEAYSEMIKGDSKLREIAENPYFKDALKDAVKLAEANKVSPKYDMTQFLHYVKLSLDKQLSKTGDTALSSTEKGAVQDVKSRLTDWLGEKNPLYGAARKQFAKESVPINQMQVGQELEKKLVAPLEDAERATVFANAVREAPKTIKSASTGGPRFQELGDVLDPKQVETVNSIVEDLARRARYERLAKGTNTGGATGLAEGTESVTLPNLLSRPAMLANYILKKVGHGADEKINALAAQQYLNPQMLAESLKRPVDSKAAAIIEELLRRTQPAMAGQFGNALSRE